MKHNNLFKLSLHGLSLRQLANLKSDLENTLRSLNESTELMYKENIYEKILLTTVELDIRKNLRREVIK